MLQKPYREAFTDRDDVFGARRLLVLRRCERKASGSTPNIAMIFIARARGIPSFFAVSSRDKGLKSSLTGRRIFHL